ncbi:MAG: flagellin [Armatimonadetes bacterium]|nr:flagellin [Armatimonadota bacterium]
MSLRINLNSAAMTAHRQLAATDSAVSKSIERLSSGYKINNAGDDPAGLVISEKLRAQVGGLNQAIKNAGDAVNMVKTAEGALSEVNRLLRTMRDLAVHAANTGVNDSASLAADQAQIRSAIESINKISSETQFGGKTLLDGSAGIVTTVKGSAVMSADLGKANLSSALTGISVDLSAGGTQLASKATLTGSVAINADMTGKSITINGKTIAGGANEAATLQAINNVANETGVVATVDASHNLILTQKSYGSANRIDVTGGTDMFGAASSAAVGADARAIVSSGGNNVTDAVWSSGSGTILKDSLGNAIQLTDAAATTAAVNADQIDLAVGSLTFQVGAYAGQTRSLNISSSHTSQLGLASGAGSTTNVAAIDVVNNATDAITVLDKAISDISSLRANLGATLKNTFESSINSLGIAAENIAASESTIRDTDMAAEMVEFTRNQIMQQAGTAMLAQANQAPQALLRLLG